MKQLIIDVLEDMSIGQLNLTSEAARKTIANTIVAAMKTNKKGWFLDLGAIDGKPKLTKEELETQRAKESWICAICGKSTYDVEYDYIGSGTNHLGCELKLELEEPVRTEDGEYVEDIDEQAHAQGRGSSYDGDKRVINDRRKDDRREREKNWLQKKHEDKVFGDDLIIGVANEEKVSNHQNWVDKLAEEVVSDNDTGYIYESPDGGKTVYKRKEGSDKREKVDWDKLKHKSA